MKLTGMPMLRKTQFVLKNAADNIETQRFAWSVPHV